MRDTNFSAAVLDKGFKSKSARTIMRELGAAEIQALELVRIFRDQRYVTVDQLVTLMQRQNVPAVKLPYVVAFLAGYLTAENFDSEFDVAVFGSMSVMEGKADTVQAAVTALLIAVEEKGILKFRNRVKRVASRKRPSAPAPSRKR